MLKKYTIPLLFLLACVCCISCEKVNVTFSGNSNDVDPNVVYIDNYKVNVATMKLDSFATSGNQVFMLGTHFDSAFGKISANSYASLQLPSNPVKGVDVIFDSLMLVLKPNGNFYGDTSLAYKITAYRLTENITPPANGESNTSLYYPDNFQYDPAPLGQIITRVNPLAKKEVDIRLSDQFGSDLLTRLKNNDPSIQSQDSFTTYFHGIRLATDSGFNKDMYYFTGDSSKLLKLYYRERSSNFTEKEIDFSYVTATQFNNIIYNFSGTPFSLFPPFKKQVISSTLMNNKAYVDNNIPSYAEITFPDILSLKELYPYIKVIQAQLEITPAPGSFTYPNVLPPTLRMYVSNSNDNLDNVLTGANGYAQTGNLSIDYLYGQNTNYTFDITNYINTIINEGHFSTKTLLLAANSSFNYDGTSRLIFNDQSGNGIKLKLYVLGL